MELSRNVPHANAANERERAKTTSRRGRRLPLSPGICSSAPRWYIQRSETPLRSGFVGRPPATLEKRIPINTTSIPRAFQRLPVQRGSSAVQATGRCGAANEKRHADLASISWTPQLARMLARRVSHHYWHGGKHRIGPSAQCRSFTPELKTEAVRLCQIGDRTIPSRRE